MLVNALRAHMAEFGFIAAKGLAHVEELVEAIEDDETPIPDLALSILRVIVAQLNDTDKRVREFDAKLAQWHRENKTSKLLATVPGVGVMGASAIAATVTDPAMFDSGRDFAAWLGMTPRQNSSGGKERLGRVSKRGDNISAGCLSAALSPSFATREVGRPPRASGCAAYWRESQRRSSHSRSLTRPPGSSGPL